MKNVKEFIKNLTDDDIDLIDKLDNLCGHGQISTYAYNLMKEEDNFENANDYIKEILIDDIGDTEFAEECIDFIVKETNNLYEQGLCEKNDFTAGLYNCDDLYLYVITDVLDCYFEDLENLKEGYATQTI